MARALEMPDDRVGDVANPMPSADHANRKIDVLRVGEKRRVEQCAADGIESHQECAARRIGKITRLLPTLIGRLPEADVHGAPAPERKATAAEPQLFRSV